jgi:hypothetical protein
MNVYSPSESPRLSKLEEETEDVSSISQFEPDELPRPGPDESDEESPSLAVLEI